MGNYLIGGICYEKQILKQVPQIRSLYLQNSKVLKILPYFLLYILEYLSS